MSDIERIVKTIGSKPVLGHWPHMQAHKDIEILRALAAEMAEAKSVNAAIGYAESQNNARMLSAEASIRALEALVNRAIAVVNEWIVPNGCSAEAAMGAMIEIFDSPEQRAAMPQNGKRL